VLLLKTALLTAQRREKVATLKWDDVVDGVWEIASDKREKATAGRLPLPPMVREIIEAQPRLAGNPFVFAAGKGSGPFNSFSQRKEELDSGLPKTMPHWTLHDLRRTARSLMSRAGVRPDLAERVLGHAIPGIEGVYDRHSYETEKGQALAALGALVGQVLDPSTAKVARLADHRRSRARKRASR
jgi:integrase